MSMTISLILVVFFLLMNAFFVVAEFALVRVRKSQLLISADEGKSGAKWAIRIAENLNAYLSACQLGITIASLALGWLGEPTVSELIRPLLNIFGVSESALSAISFALGFIIITALHIVIGELIPKSLAIFSTEKYARLTAFTLVCFYRITFPIMWVFNTTTNLIMKAIGHDILNEQEAYTGDEIRILMSESSESGLIDSEQKNIVDNVFELYDKSVSSIMTPRTDMTCFDLEDSYEENLKLIKKCKFTRYPVCDGEKDHIVGFVHIKDIYLCNEEVNYDNLPIREILAVSETMLVKKLIQLMQNNAAKMVLVVDEYGGTVGIVTMSDIMSHMIGTIYDEYVTTDASEHLENGDNNIILGSSPVSALKDIIGFIPKEAGDCETVAGLLLNIFGSIPNEGASANITSKNGEYRFTVISMKGNAIREIEIS